jgi:adenine-specific DNA-methyltransferase
MANNNNNTPLDQLKGFLNQLFQFDSQDLDFGVYKILHYKRKEIASFIDQLLVHKVKEQLQTLSADESKQIKEQIADLEKDDIIKGWLEAEADEKKTLEKFGKDKINQYKELKAKATEAAVSVETENQIYNHLTLFFSRYYDKGDFISKRRFGKNEKYMVPYNGEETHFHWANHDQYYIKSSETFNHYAFKVQTMMGNLVVNFKLHNAQLEQGNVKADEPNFFLLADKAPEIKEKDDSELNFVLANKQPDVSEKEITIYFEYRPLADDEKKKVKGNSKQDNLDEIAFEYLKRNLAPTHSLPTYGNLPRQAGSRKESPYS